MEGERDLRKERSQMSDARWQKSEVQVREGQETEGSSGPVVECPEAVSRRLASETSFGRVREALGLSPEYDG
jgi:hypothetical protein